MNSGKKTLLRARWVAPMGAPLIGDGAVVFEGGKIVAVGDASELCREHRDAEQIDLAESVLLPGLINSHVHLELSDLGRLPSSLPLPPGEGRGEGGGRGKLRTLKVNPPSPQPSPGGRGSQSGARRSRIGSSKSSNVHLNPKIHPAFAQPSTPASPNASASASPLSATSVGRRV